MQGVRISELLQSKKALITDLDGTLVDLHIDWDSLRERVRRVMGWDHPLRPLGRSIPQAARSEEEVKRAFKIVEEEELKAASRARPDEELRKFFVSLRRKGFRLGLVTMQASRSTILVLRNMDLADLFDVIVTREYSLDRREQLVYALKKLGVKGGDCVFLGDMEWDVRSGKEIGCLTICVGGKIEGADLYVRDISEIFKY